MNKIMLPILALTLIAIPVLGETLQDANKAYIQSLLDLENLKQHQFPIRSIEDTILDMREALQGIPVEELKEKARILNESREQEKMILAITLYQIVAESERTGLKPGVNYTYVVERGKWIKQQHDLAFLAYDLLARESANVDSLNETLDLSIVRQTLQQAATAFSQERYTEVQPLIERMQTQLEDARVDAARERAYLRLARRNIVNYAQDHWKGLLLTLLITGTLLTWAYLEIRVKRTIKHIKTLKLQLGINKHVQKTTQEEYYTAHIGHHLYKARMDRYKHTERHLKKEIQVYEQLLKDYKKKTLLQKKLDNQYNQ